MRKVEKQSIKHLCFYFSPLVLTFSLACRLSSLKCFIVRILRPLEKQFMCASLQLTKIGLQHLNVRYHYTLLRAVHRKRFAGMKLDKHDIHETANKLFVCSNDTRSAIASQNASKRKILPILFAGASSTLFFEQFSVSRLRLSPAIIQNPARACYRHLS